MTVTFCGHSKITNRNAISKWLDVVLPSFIEGGATTFYLGGYGDVDLLAAAEVKQQEVIYPDIEAVLVLPYLNRSIDASGYDRITYPLLEKVPPRYAIIRRNQWMVEKADVVISGVIHNCGGAAKTLNHARRKRKVIFQYPNRAREI